MSVRRRVRDRLTRNKERASLSFFIVIMFFAVFVVIVVTEVLMMDDRGTRGAGVFVRMISYDDLFQKEDEYHGYRAGGTPSLNGKLKETSISGKKNAIDMSEPMDYARAVDLPFVINDDRVMRSMQKTQTIIEDKLPQIGPELIADNGRWQPVNGTRFKFFVFSAYYDRRDTNKLHKMIRVIGATKTRLPDHVWCRFWYDTKNTPTNNSSTNNTITTTPQPSSQTVLAKIKMIRENWNLMYSACFVLCPISKTATEIPTSVSIVSKLKLYPSNHLLVKNTDRELNVSNIPNKLGVCVKQLHFSYNQSLHMLEFLELNSLLGVSSFTFYNHTVSDQVGCILREYQRNGAASVNNGSAVTISILPWQLNLVSQKEIRTEGLFSALNDCLYRNMYRMSHLALIDLDEFIIPKHNRTLPDLIKWMGQRVNTKNTGAYSFQNTFFYLQWDDDDSIFETKDKVLASMITLKKTRRRSKVHPHKQRSKYICRPEKVIEAGNHFIWEFMSGQGTLNIPASTGMLHHYRVCEFGGNDCVKTASFVDRTAYRYRDQLVDRVTQKYLELKDKCHLPDLPPVPKVRPTQVIRSPVFRKTIRRRRKNRWNLS